ncbi:DUF255 domain-containing protein [Herbiconiux sp. 11R-BC]|uniref:thioredoxin domain-containing protein n=1 Tax=Herbiconiux sp. 11R-BC TaxID=3111637 RepID=UPI003C0F9E36
MTNRLATAISPYLRSHAENPVDWYPWGEEAFAAARRREVPVLVSIGYSTCHWCHVMARESFSDPVLAAYLNEKFVAIKVDREEHPEVDTVYLAAAGAFTENLGWPLNVFVTPEGKAFYGGTYSPPAPIEGHPSFQQVLGAVNEAWSTHRSEVLTSADAVAEALAAGQRALADREAGTAAGTGEGEARVAPVAGAVLDAVVAELAAYEDAQFGGFGGAPKFPVATVLRFLLAAGTAPATALALRTLRAMAASELRDPVEGGFFRYATRRDWSEPHYERMLYDNALLLDAYVTAWTIDTSAHWAREAAEGVARFLIDVMQLPSGGFASAQDSESTVDGERVEGGYYRLDAAARARQTPPALDEKVLSGWNGLAVGALARASLVFGQESWATAAEHAADYLLQAHALPGGRLVRASIDGRVSDAVATLEDYGMLAEGLLRLAAARGSARYATAGRMLVDAVMTTGGPVFRAPGGGDPVLRAQGLAVELDPSEGAYPSGMSATASAALLLHALTAERRYREAAQRALAPLVDEARARPISFGATLELLVRLARPSEQLVLIEPDAAGFGVAATGEAAAGAGIHAGSDARMAADGLRAEVRMWSGADVVARATEQGAAMLADAGFELFADRPARDGHPTAYRCTDFVCRLPATSGAQLRT